MKNNKRNKFNKQFFNSLRIQSGGILCEECGTVYDHRTGEGLCRYCAEGEEMSASLSNHPEE